MGIFGISYVDGCVLNYAADNGRNGGIKMSGFLLCTTEDGSQYVFPTAQLAYSFNNKTLVIEFQLIGETVQFYKQFADKSDYTKAINFFKVMFKSKPELFNVGENWKIVILQKGTAHVTH